MINGKTNYLLSRMCEAAAGVIFSPLHQFCQVPLPASLTIYRDSCHHQAVSSSCDDDLRLIQVADGAGIPVRGGLKDYSS